MTINEERVLKDLLKDGFTYITKVDGDNNHFRITDDKRSIHSLYLNMQGNPMFGLKGKMFSFLRKGHKYSIKELLK